MAYFEPGTGGSGAAHQHGSHCYWDCRDCAWHCEPVPVAVREAAAAVLDLPEPVEGSLLTR